MMKMIPIHISSSHFFIGRERKWRFLMSNHYFDPRLKIFALNSNRPLAEKIAAAVGVELGKCSV